MARRKTRKTTRARGSSARATARPSVKAAAPTSRVPVAKTYKLYGTDVKSGVTEVDFTGGNLPDAWYDEFVVTGTIADSFKPGDVVYFPVVQECGPAATRWIEIPSSSQKVDDLKHPAPHLNVVSPRGGASNS